MRSFCFSGAIVDFTKKKRGVIARKTPRIIHILHLCQLECLCSARHCSQDDPCCEGDECNSIVCSSIFALIKSRERRTNQHTTLTNIIN